MIKNEEIQNHDHGTAHYEICNRFQKYKFINELNDDEIKKLQAFDVLPLRENEMFEKAFKKHFSMARNRNLECKWKQYNQTIEYRKFAPVQLPETKDLRFYNNTIRYMPSLSIKNQDHRIKRRAGPGVDHLGKQLPIPQDALLKRNVISVKNNRQETRQKTMNKNLEKKGKLTKPGLQRKR